MSKTRVEFSQQSDPTSIHIHPKELTANLELSSDLDRIFMFLEKNKDKCSKIKKFQENKFYQILNITISFSLNISRYKNKKGTFNYAVYSTNDLLGKGSCGSVYKIMGKLKHVGGKIIYHPIDPNKEEKQRAIKCQTVSNEECKIFQKNENELQQLFPDLHTRPISFIRENGKVASSEMVMQKLPGQELYEVLFSDYTTIERFQLSFNLALDLQHIHNSGVIHGDYKPENVMVNIHNQMRCQTIDFGFSRKKGAVLSNPSGTPQYLAPEMTIPWEWKESDERIDIYALGLILKLVWQDEILIEKINLDKDIESLLSDLKWTFTEQVYPNIKIPFEVKNPDKLIHLLKNLTAPWPVLRLPLDEALYSLFELTYEELGEILKNNADNLLWKNLVNIINTIPDVIPIENLPIYMDIILATAKYLEEPKRIENKNFLKVSCEKLFKLTEDAVVSQLIGLIDNPSLLTNQGLFSPSKKRKIDEASERIQKCASQRNGSQIPKLIGSAASFSHQSLLSHSKKRNIDEAFKHVEQSAPKRKGPQNK